jgi:hypothetical protein
MREIVLRARQLAGALVIGGLMSGAETHTAEAQSPLNTLSAQEKAAGWRLLFDGTSTAGWRAYNADSMPAGWQAVDGSLTRVSRAADIITREQFSDFELTLEWKLEARGNSGIFYRAVEGLEWIYHGAEYQVLDDAGHRDGQNPLIGRRRLRLYPAPRGVVKPAGEWNSTRIVAKGPTSSTGSTVRRSSNGRSATGPTRVAGAKFAAWPRYGKAMRGHIGLQEHGGRAEFRNIKIRELK